MRRYGEPETIVTDKLKSYGAAMKEIGVSIHPFTISLSAFAMQSPAVQRFNQERHQYSRHNFKKNRSAALNE